MWEYKNFSNIIKLYLSLYLIIHSHFVLSFFNCCRNRRNSELDALFVMRLRLHVLRQVPLRLERKVAVPASVRPEV